MTTPAAADGQGTSGADPSWAAGARASLADTDARLAARFDAGEDATALTVARARAVDALVREAWQSCIGRGSALSLFAVGGYGRGELFPHSDIDLLVLAEPAAQQAGQAALACFLAMVWDAGLHASQAVRSLAQCTEAAADQSVLTALLEARELAAADGDAQRLQDAIAPERVWPARAYFDAKVAEQEQRHARFGDTSDNLEPNLKDGPGGLRDLHLLGWLAQRSYGVRALAPLVELGHLGQDEADALDRERRVLCRLRYGLHLVANRREERLRFDYQKLLAERMGFRDIEGALAVEQMMQGFYRSAGVVRRINERLLQRFEEQFDGAVRPRPIDEHFARHRDDLAHREAGWLLGDVAHVFALFATWAADASLRGLHSQTARELAQGLERVPPHDQATSAQRAAFMALLRGPQAVRTLERMARLGVLGRWIPAFQQVSGRMQFDLFHVYTVDQHTLAVLRNLAQFASGEGDDRFAVAHRVWPSLRKPELLLLAGLFHDIGKGRGGDHSELGAVDARRFCEAHGLSEADTALVEWLVRHHLLMSVTAQKQDITDPQVIHRFAAVVADRQRLDYLYLLTCADIAGTSPKLWNSWKDRLLADLHTATRLALRRGLEHPVAAEERIAENRDAARGLLADAGHDEATIDAMFARMPRENFLRSRPEQIAWQALALRGAAPDRPVVAVRPMAGRDGLELLVHMPDQDGLFAAIVIALDRLGMGVLQARVLDAPGGNIHDTFQLLPTDARHAPGPAHLQAALARALEGELSRLQPTRRTQPRHLRHFRVAPQLDFDPIAGGTRIGLICTDRPGLLADIASVLRAQRLRVHDARIATFGERAEDLFLVSDERDQPLDDARREQLRDGLLAVLDGDHR